MAEGAEKSQDVKVVLKSNDQEEFEIPAKVALQSRTVKNFMEVETWKEGEKIPLDVRSSTLAKVLEFCKHLAETGHAPGSPAPSEGGEESDEEDDDDIKFDLDEDTPPEQKNHKLSAYEEDFLVDMERPLLWDLMKASNYLEVQPLLDCLVYHVANMIRPCKDADAVRTLLGLTCDLSPEDIKDIKEKNTFAVE